VGLAGFLSPALAAAGVGVAAAAAGAETAGAEVEAAGVVLGLSSRLGPSSRLGDPFSLLPFGPSLEGILLGPALDGPGGGRGLVRFSALTIFPEARVTLPAVMAASAASWVP